MSAWLAELQQQLIHTGLNVWGVADGQEYQHILPNCQSVVVIANGGRAMWPIFLQYLQEDPIRFTDSQHPLDDFIAAQINRVDPNPPPSRRWIRCAETEKQFIDFRPLAIAASLGHHSHLGMIIHQQYGLWLSLRAAILTTEHIPQSLLSSIDNPCTSCPKYCAQSCPGEAFSNDGWHSTTCANFHQQSHLCNNRCQSRLSCPIATEHQHSPAQHHYHSARKSGRKLIASWLKVEDKQVGIDLPWKG